MPPGTVFREDPLATLRQVAPEEDPLRFSPPPDSLPEGTPEKIGALLALTACEDSQGAYELEAGGRRQGAFTYHLVHSLARLGAEATWADLREHTLARLLGGFSNQWPCFTGELDGKVPRRQSGSSRPQAVTLHPKPECASISRRRKRSRCARPSKARHG